MSPTYYDKYSTDFVNWFSNILEKKKQVILYGPPGTGKTYFAKHYCKSIKKPYGIVQFHPTYEYSDFVQGWVPNADENEGTDDGAPFKFTKKKKIFCKLIDHARTFRKEKYYLIIDEINRGNLGKIFGELITGLDDRNYEIILLSGDKITIPDNLYIIGTMNSADRSVGVIDKALRRRFHFIFFPPSSRLLERALKGIEITNISTEDKDNYIRAVIDLFRKINYHLLSTGNDVNMLIGHTYFIQEGWEELTDELELTIFPLIEELFPRRKEMLTDLYEELKEWDCSEKIL
ncbi:MAG: McrB family protein, partial [Candidatus Odinarchaeota archaeon]